MNRNTTPNKSTAREPSQPSGVHQSIVVALLLAICVQTGCAVFKREPIRPDQILPHTVSYQAIDQDSTESIVRLTIDRTSKVVGGALALVGLVTLWAIQHDCEDDEDPSI